MNNFIKNKFIQFLNNDNLKIIQYKISFLIIRFIIIILFLFSGKFIMNKLQYIFDNYIIKNVSDKIIVEFFIQIINKCIYFIYLCIFFKLLGITTTTLLTIFGTAGVGIALSLKDSLSNIAAGIIIITIVRPFKKDDYVVINNIEGTIIKTDLFSTKLISPEKNIIYIGNSKILDNTIINYTTSGVTRSSIQFGVNYNTNIIKMKNLIEKILNEEIGIKKETFNSSKPFMNIKSYSNNSIIIEIRFYSSRSEKWKIYYNILDRIKELLDKNEIDIPFPQLELSIKNTDDLNISISNLDDLNKRQHNSMYL